LSFSIAHLNEIQQAISALAPQRNVRIIAVTKTVGVEAIREARAAGIKDIGENRLQEALNKFSDDSLTSLERHFIGPIQSNKLKKMATAFHWFHALDSEKNAVALSKLEHIPKILIQVNSSGEPQKHGLYPDQLADFLEKIQKYPDLQIKGLMTIGPNTDDEKAIQKSFRILRELQEYCRRFESESIQLQELSMGMSHDYPLALKEGATMLRIGTYLFGERNG